MKRFLIFMTLFIGTLYCADSFLVDEPPVKRREVRQAKQEITQLMGSLVEKISSSLELEAQIQKKLCKELRFSLEGSKESRLLKASQKDLQALRTALRKEHARIDQQQALKKRFLAFLG